MTNKLLTAHEVAQSLRVSVSSVYRLTAQRKIRYYSVLGVYRYDIQEVLEDLANGKRAETRIGKMASDTLGQNPGQTDQRNASAERIDKARSRANSTPETGRDGQEGCRTAAFAKRLREKNERRFYSN